MNNRWVLALIAILTVGVTLGVLGGIYLFDDDSPPSDDSPTASVVPADCLEAQAVVETSNESMIALAAEAQVEDATYFAAILSHQRAITFAMEAEPACFTLLDRAGAEGLVEGIQGLLEARIANPPPAPTTTIVEPGDE